MSVEQGACRFGVCFKGQLGGPAAVCKNGCERIKDGPAPWFPASQGVTAFDTLRLQTDRTLAFTWGRWGGFYCKGGPGFWRVCAGWVAVTFIRDECVAVLRAYLDRVEADALAVTEQPLGEARS